MNLLDLFETDTVQKIMDIKKAYDRYVGQYGMGDPARVPPQYAREMNRLKNELRAYRQQRELEKSGDALKSDVLNVKAQLSNRKSDPNIVKQRFSQAVSQGLHTSQDVRNQYGGYEGIANYLNANINKLTSNKTEPFDMEALSNYFNVLPRTIHKWFERPEFKYLRAFMPSEFKRGGFNHG